MHHDTIHTAGTVRPGALSQRDQRRLECLRRRRDHLQELAAKNPATSGYDYIKHEEISLTWAIRIIEHTYIGSEDCARDLARQKDTPRRAR